MKENILNEYGLVSYDSYQLSNWSNSRKIAINSHGNIEKEASRGQIPITSEILLQAPLVITEADEIKLSQRKFNEKPVLIFRKMLHGKITVVAYVSTSKQDLAILTMYATKKGTSATPTND